MKLLNQGVSREVNCLAGHRLLGRLVRRLNILLQEFDVLHINCFKNEKTICIIEVIRMVLCCIQVQNCDIKWTHWRDDMGFIIPYCVLINVINVVIVI